MAIGNPWFSAVEQTLPQYVPLPFQELAAAGQAVQGRYDQAMNTLDQTATGLASIEARLPSHQQYISNYANKFREEADQLLGRYNYNAADPQFNRELTRLRSKYVNDPNLRTILMANEADKRNSELAARMAAEGRLFINPQARGVDDQGRLINDVGQLRGVNTLDNWASRLKAAANTRVEYGNLVGNRPNLETAQNQILDSIRQGSPEVQDLIQAYISRGMTLEQAQQQAAVDATRMIGEYAIEEGTNWQKMNFEASERDRALRRATEAAKQNRAGALIALSSPLEVKNLNENLIKNVDSMLRGIDDKGNLKSREQIIQATPENIKKYPNARPMVVGTSGQSMLVIPKGGEKSEDDIRYLESIKTELGSLLPEGANDRQVLERYKDYLKADNNAPTFWASPVAEIKNNIRDQYFGSKGQNLGDAIIVDKKGKHKRVASGEIDLSEIDAVDFTGITTSPVRGKGYEFAGGAMKGVAVNKDGEVVTIYKPLPPQLAQYISVSNGIDRAIASSNATNDVLRTDPQYRILGQNIVPQKRNGRILLYEVDNQGNLVGDYFSPEQVDALKNQEKVNISNYFSLHQNTD